MPGRAQWSLFLKYFNRLIFLSVCALAACDRDPVADVPVLPVTVSPARAYAGGPVTIRSAAFAQRQNIEIWVDTFRLTTLRAAGDTVVVALPASVRGQQLLRLGRDGLALGSVEVAGYAGRRTINRQLGIYLAAWPQGGRASVIAGPAPNGDSAWSNGEVWQLFPATGEFKTLVTGFRVGYDNPRIPGPTPDPGVVVLQPIGGSAAQTWRLLPSPQIVDTLPEGNTRHLAVFNDSTYLRATHHYVYSAHTPARWLYHAAYEETHEIILSPANDRATLRVNGSETGPPVFDMMTGDTAYHVRDLYRSYGAAFSQNGDTLWMLGVTRPPAYETAVLMLNARTGEVYERAVLTEDHYAVHMRRDPDTGRLFIFSTRYPEFAADLTVRDDRSLELLGRIHGPRAGGCSNACEFGLVVLGVDGLFIVTPREIMEFDYLR